MNEADFNAIQRRLEQCEMATELITWLQSSKYRHLIHRHDGSFRASDERMNVTWTTDRIDQLYALIKANPVTERAP